jgi:hypothetical protein
MPFSFLKSDVLPDAVPRSVPFIPRLLWQTTRDINDIDPKIATCIEKLTTLNPDWKHHLFDDQGQTEFLQSVSSDRFMRVYERVPREFGAARADLFRYMVVFLRGGAYFDIKSGTSKPLSSILRPEDQYILSQWDNGPDGAFPGAGLSKSLAKFRGGEYEQWFVISRPGHPFLAAVIEQVLSNVENYNPFRVGHGGKGVLNTYGPNTYTRTIHANLHLGESRMISASKEGLHYTLLEDLNAHQFLDKNYYGRHVISPVTDHGLRGFRRLRYWLLESAYFPISQLRSLNHRRLARRRAIRRASVTDNLGKPL